MTRKEREAVADVAELLIELLAENPINLVGGIAFAEEWVARMQAVQRLMVPPGSEEERLRAFRRGPGKEAG